MGKNKLRQEHSKAPYIYLGVIGFLILFGCCCYLAYIIMDFQNVNQTDTVTIYDMGDILNMLTAPFP